MKPASDDEETGRQCS